MNKVIDLCKQIVTCLEKGNYNSLREHNALSRVSEEDIKRVLKEYGGCISTIPNEAFQTSAFRIYRYHDNSGLKIDLDLWVNGERSDLTLQIEVKTDGNNNIDNYRIMDVLVM